MPAAVVFEFPGELRAAYAHEPLVFLRAVLARLVVEDLVEQEMQSFTISEVTGGDGPLRVRVATVDEKLGNALDKTAGVPVRVGAIDVELRRVESHPLAGHCSYEDLFRNTTPQEKGFAFEFLSPASFHHADLDVPLPLPRLLFGGLYRRWKQSHTRVALHEEVVDAADHHLAIVSHKIETMAFREDKSSKTGFVGSASFRVSGGIQRAILHELNALADFSFYASIGQKTQVGMGQVRRVLAGR